jgi:hypothetical protein
MAAAVHCAFELGCCCALAHCRYAMWHRAWGPLLGLNLGLRCMPSLQLGDGARGEASAAVLYRVLNEHSTDHPLASLNYCLLLLLGCR